MAEWKPKIKAVQDCRYKEFLRLAYQYAWIYSEDLVTKNAAVIVNIDSAIIGKGANHFPEGLNPVNGQLKDRDWKYRHIIHAEPAAIHSAAKAGKSTDGATMYMPWVPCVPCAKVVIDAGIKRLIGHRSMIAMTPERWWDDCGYVVELLEKCGVEYVMYEGKIGGVRCLFDGKEWEP